MNLLRKIGKAWMYICTGLMTLGLLAGIAYFLINPASKPSEHKAIESCLDSGGAWNDELKSCIHSS